MFYGYFWTASRRRSSRHACRASRSRLGSFRTWTRRLRSTSRSGSASTGALPPAAARASAHARHKTICRCPLPSLHSKFELIVSRRLSKLWSSSITASVICTAVCAMANIHYLTNRESYYFLQNMCVAVPLSPVLFLLFWSRNARAVAFPFAEPGNPQAAFSLPFDCCARRPFISANFWSREI